jgi:hypothetical protein
MEPTQKEKALAAWLVIGTLLAWSAMSRKPLEADIIRNRITDGMAQMEASRVQQDLAKYNQCVMLHGKDYCAFYELAGKLESK